MTAPILDYKTRETSFPRGAAPLLIAWTAFNLFVGGLITLVSFFVFVNCVGHESMQEETIGSSITLAIGSITLSFGARMLFTCAGVSRRNVHSLRQAARESIAGELFAYAAWATIYIAFFIREPAWENPHRLLNFILAGICTLALPATTTLTRIYLRAAWRASTAHAQTETRGGR
jgi:hypothetical protein